MAHKSKTFFPAPGELCYLGFNWELAVCLTEFALVEYHHGDNSNQLQEEYPMNYPYLRAFLALSGCDKAHIAKIVKRAGRAKVDQTVICQHKELGWLTVKDLERGNVFGMVKHEANLIINK